MSATDIRPSCIAVSFCCCFCWYLLVALMRNRTRSANCVSAVNWSDCYFHRYQLMIVLVIIVVISRLHFRASELSHASKKCLRFGLPSSTTTTKTTTTTFSYPTLYCLLKTQFLNRFSHFWLNEKRRVKELTENHIKSQFNAHLNVFIEWNKHTHFAHTPQRPHVRWEKEKKLHLSKQPNIIVFAVLNEKAMFHISYNVHNKRLKVISYKMMLMLFYLVVSSY